MKISLISNLRQNFKASLKNQTYIDYWGDRREHTQYEVTNSYDSQIKAIQKAKEKAKELDTFMRSDEVQRILSTLPDNRIVEMHNKFEADTSYSDDEISIHTPYLEYYYKHQQNNGEDEDENKNKSEDEVESDIDKRSLFVCKYNINGQLDKDAIINWLHRIRQLD